MSEFKLNETEVKAQLLRLNMTKVELYSVRAGLDVQILKLRLTNGSNASSAIRGKLGSTCKKIGNEITNINSIINTGNTICSKAKTAERTAQISMAGLSDYPRLLDPVTVSVVFSLLSVVAPGLTLPEFLVFGLPAISTWFDIFCEQFGIQRDGTLLEKDENAINDIVNNAEEPYKSIYEDNKDKYNLGHTHGKDTGYYTNEDNTINVDMYKEPNNPRGPYTTYFHESGHAIDYNYKDDGSYYSLTYRNSNGESLQDVIYKDVRNDVTNTVNEYASGDTAQHIVDYIMSGGRDGSLTDAERRILDDVLNDYRTSFKGAVNEAASDVYGGVTDNLTLGDGCYGHRDDGYWYTTDGQPTGMQSLELWAEYYSYAMTGNEAAMQALRERFPEASEFLDEMARSMQ